MLTRNSTYIIAGFALLLTLMVGLTAIGLSQMSAINHRLETIVEKHNTRTDLVFTMRRSARERLILLQAMAISDDLFERDALFNRFQQYAADFTNARNALAATALSDSERAILAKQAEYARISSSLSDQVIDLITAGNHNEANQTFLRKLIPAQNDVLTQLDELLAFQRQASHLAVKEASASYSYATVFMSVLGGAALVLGVITTWLVTRTVSRAQDEVFNEKELAEVTLHSIGDAVITTDAKGNVGYLNPVAEKLTGWFAHEARGLALNKVFNAIREVTREPIEYLSEHDLLDNPNVEPNLQALLISRDGQEFAVESSIAPIRNRAGDIIGLVLIFRDVTKSRFLAQQLTWQASHDALTGLANRPEFQRRLSLLLESAKVQHKHHALLYLDLDQFKVVNDTCGHVIGDELLRQLSAILEARVRKGDTLARLGGDEFGLLLENCPLDQAERIADNLREAIHNFRFVWMDRLFEIGVSIGLVSIDNESPNPASILSAADAACYAAKDRGRNRVHIFQPDDSELLRRQGEMQWISRINKALEEERFRLRFQQIVVLSGRHSQREFFEVLLDMVDETGNTVRAPVFLPAAERYGIMPTIDRWVIRSLFSSQGPVWRKKWKGCYEHNGECPFLCSINLSATSINDEHFLDFVFQQIAEHEIPPSMLCFEITETAAITNLNKASHFMHQLKNIGCHFALDDFGNGMSSFAYLKNLPVDFLKIDGSFVKDMVHDPIDFAMVEAINRIGHIMGIKTIAEFVESDAILAKLKEIGVDYAQGDGIHRPQLLRNSADVIQLKKGVRKTS